MTSFKAMKTASFRNDFLEATTNINIFLNNEINGVYISNTYSKQIKIL